MRTTHHAIRQAGLSIGSVGLVAGLAVVTLSAVTASSVAAFFVLAESGLIGSYPSLAAAVAVGLLSFAVAEACVERAMLRTGLWVDHVLGPRLLKAGLAAADPASDLLDTNRALGELRDILIGSDMKMLINIPLKIAVLVGLAIAIPSIGLWALAGFAAAMGVAVLGAIVLVRRNADRQAKSRIVRRGVVEAAAEGHALVGLGLAEHACRAGAAYNRRWIAAAFRFGRTASDVSVLHRTLLGAALLWCLGLIATQFTTGELSTVPALALASILALILSPLINMPDAVFRALIARAAWRRLSGVALDEAAHRLFSAPDTAGRSATLALRDVDFAYPRSRPILKHTSLVLGAGEGICLHGAPGAGKSTVAALLAGGRVPTGGLALIGDAPVGSHQSTTSRPRVSWLTEDPLLLEGTVAENISRFCDDGHEAAMAAVRRAGVAGILASLEHGLETWVTPGGLSLSLRQRRAVALARTLYGTPEFLVLDEPETGLDDVGVAELADALFDLKAAGAGLCLVSTHPRLIALADRSYLIANGALMLLPDTDWNWPALAAADVGQTNRHAD